MLNRYILELARYNFVHVLKQNRASKIHQPLYNLNQSETQMQENSDQGRPYVRFSCSDLWWLWSNEGPHIQSLERICLWFVGLRRDRLPAVR